MKRKLAYPHGNRAMKKITVYSLVSSKYRNAITETIRQIEEYEDIEKMIQEIYQYFLPRAKEVK